MTDLKKLSEFCDFLPVVIVENPGRESSCGIAFVDIKFLGLDFFIGILCDTGHNSIIALSYFIFDYKSGWGLAVKRIKHGCVCSLGTLHLAGINREQLIPEES